MQSVNLNFKETKPDSRYIPTIRSVLEPINTMVFPIVRKDFILTALKSLYEYTPYNFQVIVVDQTQQDDEFAARLRPFCDLHIKSCKYNMGYAQATNLGLRLANTKYITASNDDVIFLPHPYQGGWFEGITKAFDQYDTVGAVNPMSPVEPGWGYNEPENREYLSFRECFNPSNIHNLIKEKKGQVIDGIVMWCTVFSKKFLDDVGYHCELFRPGGSEDYDMNCRGRQKGYRLLATSRSWVWHFWGQSKDKKGGLDQALPLLGEPYNKLSTKGFGDEGTWDPDCYVWGYETIDDKKVACTRIREVARFNYRL